MSIDISDTLKLLYFVKKISEHRYDIRISESCVDPNPLMVERQDPDSFTHFQTRERCALEIAALSLILLKQTFWPSFITNIIKKIAVILCVQGFSFISAVGLVFLQGMAHI